MSYDVTLLPGAQRYLARLDPGTALRIGRALEALGRNFEDRQHIALSGELRAAFRLRVGDYRVIYSADHDERLCMVHCIWHRRDVYR